MSMNAVWGSQVNDFSQEVAGHRVPYRNYMQDDAGICLP